MRLAFLGCLFLCLGRSWRLLSSLPISASEGAALLRLDFFMPPGCGPASKGETMVPGGSVIALPAKRSEEHTSELQSLMRISYAVFCLKKKKQPHTLKHEIT